MTHPTRTRTAADVAAFVDAARRRRRWSRWTVRALLPATVIAITLGPPALEELGCSYGVAREGRSIPQLVGRPLQDVEADLAGGCLRLQADRRSVADQPTGTVVEQDPPAPGSTTFRTIRVIVAGTHEDPTWRPTPPRTILELLPGQGHGEASLDGDRGVVVEEGTPTVIEELPPDAG